MVRSGAKGDGEPAATRRPARPEWNDQGNTMPAVATTSKGVGPWPPRTARNLIPRIRGVPRMRAAGNRAGGDREGATPGQRGGRGGGPSLRAAPKAGGRRGLEEGAARRPGLLGLEVHLERGPAARVRAAALREEAGPRAERAPVRAGGPPAGRAVSSSGPADLTQGLLGADMTARAANRAAVRPADRGADPAENPTASRCPQGRGPTTFPVGCGRRSA